MHRGIRVWLGCLADASLGISEERAAGQETSGSLLSWLNVSPWLCGAMSVWLGLAALVLLHFPSLLLQRT